MTSVVKMKIKIILSAVGILGVDEEDNVVDAIFFEKNPKLIAKKVSSIDKGENLEEVWNFAKKWRKKGFHILLENSLVAEKLEVKFDTKVGVVIPEKRSEGFHRDIEQFAKKLGYIKSSEELRKLIQSVSLELTRLKIKETGEKRADT